jgi:glycosyltransferase 2 family protein
MTVSQQTPKMTARIVTIIAILLAVLFLYLTLRDLNWVSFWNTLVTGQYQYLALTIPIASANYFIRSLRWGILVRSEKKISHPSIFWSNMVGYMGNAFLPARAGEVLRSVAISRNFGLSTSFVFATALTERIMDVVALILISSISLLSINIFPDSLSSALKFMTFAGLLGLFFVICSPWLEKYFLLILKHLPLPQNWIDKISNQLSLFLQGMRSLQNTRRLVSFLALTALIWFIDGCITMIGANIVSSSLSLPQSLVFLSALGLSSAVPSTPGYIGVYQFVAVLVLVPFGFTKSSALAFILISQIVGYIVVAFWGLLGLWLLKIQKIPLSDPSPLPKE